MSDTPHDVNAGQRALWTHVAGPKWVGKQHLFDRMIEPHGEAVVALLAAGQGERVLDIGCGFGTTALHVGEQVGPAGSVHGVDISPVMIERAGERAASAGADHVTFAVGDAQADDLGDRVDYDAAVSRFGVMFFSDPVVAFANIRRHVRPGGRLAFVCWQGPECNPFFALGGRVIRPALPDPPPLPAPTAPGPLALCDPDRVKAVLSAAGWDAVELASRDFPMRFDVEGGDGSDDALDHILESELGRSAATQLSTDAMESLIARLRAEIATHHTGESVVFASSVWLVHATNPG